METHIFRSVPVTLPQLCDLPIRDGNYPVQGSVKGFLEDFATFL